MKKSLLVLALAFVCVLANAQFYVGGSLGANFASVKDDDGNKLGTISSFSIAPEVGYSITDKIDLGLAFGFGTMGAKPDGGDKSSTSAWEVAPYMRYSFVEFGKFKVLGKAKLYAQGVGKAEYLAATGEYTEFGLNIAPMLTYDISDKFVLFTDLNFLGFGFSYNKVKDDNSTTSFGLNIDANNVISLGGANLDVSDNFVDPLVKIGFAYKF